MTVSAEIAARQGSDLTIRDDQSFWNDKQIAALRQLGVDSATNGDLAVFFHHAQRTGLDPFLKQIYMIGRKSRGEVKQTIQTGIDGFRVVARRAARREKVTLSYEDTQWCGADGVWRDVWLDPEHPAAARVVVLRNGERFPAVALWSEYVQTNFDGSPNSMWSRMSSNQLAKCAEALALRKAFPHDLGGVHTEDEMGQATITVSQVQQQPAKRVTAAEILGSPPVEAEPETVEAEYVEDVPPAVESDNARQLRAQADQSWEQPEPEQVS